MEKGVCSSLRIHIVQKGEILAHIAEKYNVHFDDLQRANPQLSSPDMLLPGMKIKIPGEAKSVRTVSDHSSLKESDQKTNELSDVVNVKNEAERNAHRLSETNQAHTTERPKAEAIIPDESLMASYAADDRKKSSQVKEEVKDRKKAGMNDEKRAVRMNPQSKVTNDELWKDKRYKDENRHQTHAVNRHPYDDAIQQSPYVHLNEQVQRAPYVNPPQLPYTRCCCCHQNMAYPYYGPPFRPWHQHFYY